MRTLHIHGGGMLFGRANALPFGSSVISKAIEAGTSPP